MSAKRKMQVTKEESIYKVFPAPVLNNTNVPYLDQLPDGSDPKPIRVYPSEVIFQGTDLANES